MRPVRGKPLTSTKPDVDAVRPFGDLAKAQALYDAWHTYFVAWDASYDPEQIGWLDQQVQTAWAIFINQGEKIVTDHDAQQLRALAALMVKHGVVAKDVYVGWHLHSRPYLGGKP